MIFLSSNFSVSSPVLSFIPVLYPAGMDVHKEEDVEMMLPVVLGTDTFCSMVDLDSTRRVNHEDSPFWLVVIGLSFSVDMYG